MFNLDPDDCDYVSLSFNVNKGGDHSRVTFATIADNEINLAGSWPPHNGIRKFETRN